MGDGGGADCGNRRQPYLTVGLAAILLSLTAGCAEFRYDTAELPRRASGPAPSVYVVDRGDTLYSIAWRYGLDHRTVARWNGIHAPYTIYPDQRLRLRPPSRGTRTSSGARAPERGGRAAQATPAPASSVPETSASDRSAPADGSLRWRWPTKGKVVRRFDPDRPGKKGVMIAGTVGQPVRAAASGRVVYSGDGLRGYGNLIIIKHNSRYLTAYGYNRTLLAEEGDRVSAGATIAQMGKAPTQGAALHFEIRRDGKPVDPLRYLP